MGSPVDAEEQTQIPPFPREGRRWGSEGWRVWTGMDSECCPLMALLLCIDTEVVVGKPLTNWIHLKAVWYQCFNL